jgi:hypothetical protein
VGSGVSEVGGSPIATRKTLSASAVVGAPLIPSLAVCSAVSVVSPTAALSIRSASAVVNVAAETLNDNENSIAAIRKIETVLFIISTSKHFPSLYHKIPKKSILHIMYYYFYIRR